MSNYDFSTPKQPQREAKYQRVGAEFKAIQEAHPEVKPSRIMKAMADKGVEGFTSMLGIRTALIRCGAYTPVSR